MSSRKGTTKSAGKKHDLDKFYTKPSIAAACIQRLDLASYDEIIEPSAGNGAFYSQILDCVGYDIHPELDGIIKKNWFKVARERTNKRVLIVGNPPFGQQNSLAVKFINHAAQFATTIAFILPRSFMKESIQRRLDPHLFLVSSHMLPRNSFLLDGKNADVPCAFLVWEYREDQMRATPPQAVAEGFSFVKKSDIPDLYIQRIGGNAGVAGPDWAERSDQSNYFIKLANPSRINQFIQDVNSTVFRERDHSVGPRSISKTEFLNSFLSTHTSWRA